MTVLSYNAGTPAGRAITHLLEKSALADVVDGMEVRTVGDPAQGGRSLVIHPQFEAWCSAGEGALMSLVHAFATDESVRIRSALEDVDQRSQRAIAEAVMIASNLPGFTLVQVPA